MTSALAIVSAIRPETFDGAVGIPVAFFVGMVSFFSPCILPLVPGYLSYMSGVGTDELALGRRRGRVLVATLLFVLGFAVIFSAFGASASALGGFLYDHGIGVNRVAGAIVVALGLIFLSGLFVEPLQRASHRPGLAGKAAGVNLALVGFFLQERGMHTPSRAGIAGAFPLGAAFAVGWVPCVGPGLGAIYTIAAADATVARGALLLFVFSLGFGVWFVLGGLAFDKASHAFGVIKRHLRTVTAVGGAFLLTIGILLLTNQWNAVLAPLRRLINQWTPPV